MAEVQVSQPNGQDEKMNIPKVILGLVVTIGLSLLVLYYLRYINNTCCGLGFLLLASVGLYIPKMFGLTKTQYLAIFGVLLFVVLAGAGIFLYSKPIFESNSDYASYDSEGFTNVRFEYVDGNMTVTVDHAEGANVRLEFYRVEWNNNTDYSADMTGTGTTYTCTVNGVPYGYVYQYAFTVTDSEGKKTTSAGAYYLDIKDDDKFNELCLFYSITNCLTVIAIFYLMLVLTAVMRRNLEKTRARMEAEGRLYPQGYGRCKECGSIVLPGETCCRKCGAYIDVPDELRHRKVDMVECSECGAEIPEDAKVCPKCGATFDEEEEVVYVDSNKSVEAKVEMVQCSECGEMIPETADVCPKCGAKFDEEEETVIEEKKE